MEKDFSFKMLMNRVFWNWGYLPFVDVKLIRSDAALERSDRYELTDVDVLATKFLPEYRVLTTAADCTTRKRGSMNRALFLRGLLDYIGAGEGYVVVDPQKSLPLDHRVSARAINISLIDPQDASKLIDRLEGPDSQLGSAHLFKESAYKYLANLDTLKGFSQALRYRKYRYWQDPVNEQLLNSIYLMKDISRKLDLNNKFHFVLAYCYLLMFAMASLQIAWRMASTTLISKPELLDIQLKHFLYGGEKNYRNRIRVVEFFSKKVGAPKEILLAGEESTVAPPEWKSFLELHMRLLSNPTTACDIPRVFGLALFEKVLYPNDAVYVRAIPQHTSEITFKLAMDLAQYFTLATKLPSTFTDKIREAISTTVRSKTVKETELPFSNAESSSKGDTAEQSPADATTAMKGDQAESGEAAT